MAGNGMIYSGGDPLNLPKKLEISSGDQSLDYIFASAPSNSFLGPSGMVSFGADNGVKRSEISFYRSFDQDEIGDEYLNEYLNNQPEKKRRLSIDQIEFLERKFEAENKLEPDRKIQLAKELGLQPRQISIWFQNRRARWKTKQLETDYETLHASYECLKTDYNNLLNENQKLKAEVLHLKHNGFARDIETAANLESFDNNELMSEPKLEQATADIISEDDEESKVLKNEEQSDLTDVDSHTLLIDGIHSSLLDSGGSSHFFFEPDQFDLSQNAEDNNLSKELLFQPADYIFPKMDDNTYVFPAANLCYFGFPVEDQTFNSLWSTY